MAWKKAGALTAHFNGERGFTVVELLVVIVVIGILAGIVAFTVPGYQQRTRDNQRKSDVSQIAAALNAYALKKNDFVGSTSGCGYAGHGNGFFNAGPSGSYPASIFSCLQTAEVLKETIADPSDCVSDSGGNCGTSGGEPVKAYMKATCTKDGAPVTYVLAHLEAQPRIDSEVDALCDSGSVEGFDAASQKWGSRYGMNYYATVK